MSRLASEAARRGFAAWNIEYRRVGRVTGRGGWPATFDDVAAAVAHLALLDGIDPERVAICGHSAGGHLALWCAARPHRGAIRIRTAISLAGVADLAEASRLGLGRGAVDALMGGSPSEHPERYAAGSPAALVPLGVDQLLVHGLDDATVPAAMSEQYVELASAAGDQVAYLGLPGTSHMEMIDPAGEAWQAVVAHLEAALA